MVTNTSDGHTRNAKTHIDIYIRVLTKGYSSGHTQVSDLLYRNIRVSIDLTLFTVIFGNQEELLWPTKTSSHDATF